LCQPEIPALVFSLTGAHPVAERELTPASIQRKKRSLAGVKRRWLVSAALVISDAILINIAFVLAYWIRYDLQWLRAVDPAFVVPFTVYIPFAVILTGVLILAYRRQGLYRLRQGISWFDELYGIINGTATGIVVMVVLVFILRPTFYSRLIFFYAGAIILVLLSCSRLIKNLWIRYMRRQGVGIARAIIVGAGEVGRTVMRTMVAHPDLGYEIVGFVDDDPSKGTTDIGRFKGLGSLNNLPLLVQDEAIDEVIITLPWQYHRKIMAIMAQCERENIRARIVPDLFQMTLSRMSIIEMGGIPLIGVKQVRISPFTRLLKRGVDVVFSLFVLTFAAPLMGLIALAIKLGSPGPVLFPQQRVGKGGKPFVLYKFRSMAVGAEEQQERLRDLNEADGPIFKIKEDPRVTRVGRWLRRLSLDELPQLYNVLRGDMSLIGPRPPVPEEVAHYQPWHMRRLEIAPGITGLWQVSGRSELPFDEMALLDIYYAEQWSPALDVKILLRTIPTVVFGDGAY
jgi:exopolysaccharide biosynthesis polyprenyl glycosylphosphotransferase